MFCRGRGVVSQGKAVPSRAPRGRSFIQPRWAAPCLPRSRRRRRLGGHWVTGCRSRPRTCCPARPDGAVRSGNSATNCVTSRRSTAAGRRKRSDPGVQQPGSHRDTARDRAALSDGHYPVACTNLWNRRPSPGACHPEPVDLDLAHGCSLGRNPVTPSGLPPGTHDHVLGRPLARAAGEAKPSCIADCPPWRRAGDPLAGRSGCRLHVRP